MKLWIKVITVFLSILLIGYGSYYYYYEIPKDIDSSELKQIDFKFKLSDNDKLLDGDLFNNTNRTITEVTLSTFVGLYADLIPKGKTRKYVIKVYVLPNHSGHFSLALFDSFVNPSGFEIVGGKSLP